MTSRLVVTLGTWWRSAGNALRSVLPRDHPTAITSAARLAIGRAAAPARSLFQRDWAAQEEAWWEAGQGATRVAVSREGLPRPRSATRPWRVAEEEESEDTWGMLRQPMVGMHCLPALVRSGIFPKGSRASTSFSPAERHGSRPTLGAEAFLPETFPARALGF
jgi:hypothetical protein